MANLWDYDEAISVYNEKALAADEDASTVDVPQWIEQDVSPADVAAICQGGCASGAYMRAVTYHQARETMAEHGDDIAEYLEAAGGETFPDVLERVGKAADVWSWDALACHFVSLAVDLWAASVESELDDMLEAIAEGGE